MRSWIGPALARIVSLVLLVSLLAPSRSMAQQSPATSAAVPSPYAPKFQPIPPGKDRIEPLEQGKPAPFSGQLFDTDTALRWANYLRQCREKLILDVETERKVAEAQVSFWKKTQEEDRTFFLRQAHEQQQRILALQQPSPWYMSPWAGLVTGVLVGGGLVSFGAYLKSSK
jgi:hypothetical protein